MSLLERVRAIRDAYYNEYRDRRNLFDKHGRPLDQLSDIGAGASFPRPRVRCGVWRRGIAGMKGHDDEDADESGDSEQEVSSGGESDESEAESEDDEDEDDTDGMFSSTPIVCRNSNRL
jgi:U3 small nucleolar RNA-associated protein 14